MAQNHFVYPWFKNCHFTHLRYILFVFRNPPLLKSRVNTYFCSNFLSPPKTKNNTKMQERHKICAKISIYPDFNRGGLRKTNGTYLRWVKWHFFKPRVGKVISGLTIGGCSVITPKIIDPYDFIISSIISHYVANLW